MPQPKPTSAAVDVNSARQGRTKAQWRQEVRTTRSSPPQDIATAVIDGLADYLTNSPGLILFYRSMPGEIALEPLADRIGWHWFAVTRTPESGPLTIHPSIGAMEHHLYGFQQPTDGALEVPPHHISVFLVPSLALDRSGNRLGHGAGYYDELLSRAPDDRPRIGVTTEEYLLEELPSEPHDIAMTHLATELGVREVDHRATSV